MPAWPVQRAGPVTSSSPRPWTALGLAAIYVGRSERAELKTWIGFTAVCLAQGHLALAVIRDGALSTLASGVFQTIAIALILLGTIQALRAAIASNQGLVWESMLAFQGSEARRRKEAHAHEEAIHNLRSALTSITSATHLLVSNRHVPLGEKERSHLAAALQSELDRARRLLSQEWDGGRRNFPLLDVLVPVVVNERSQGTVVGLDVAAGTTVARQPGAHLRSVRHPVGERPPPCGGHRRDRPGHEPGRTRHRHCRGQRAGPAHGALGPDLRTRMDHVSAAGRHGPRPLRGQEAHGGAGWRTAGRRLPHRRGQIPRPVSCRGRRAVAARTDRTRVERETTPESLRPPHRGAVGARRQAHALATPPGDQRSRVGGER